MTQITVTPDQPPSVLPADLAQMTVAQLAQLPASQLAEVDRNLQEAMGWLKVARSKFDAALEQRFGLAGREALGASGRDFGSTRLQAEGMQVKFELPKKVSWDQARLKEIAQRIVASGETVESYLDVKLSVSESRYTNWPASLQQQFAPARTVEAGKASIELLGGEGA
jgi:hypothetical protein